MLNRYANVSVWFNECPTHDSVYVTVQIQRFGRRYKHVYGQNEYDFHCGNQGITDSSWGRLKKLFPDIKFDELDRWYYEWQPNQKPFNEPTRILLEIAEDYETEELDDVKNGEDLENFIFGHDARSIDGDLADWCWSMVDWNYIYEQIRKS